MNEIINNIIHQTKGGKKLKTHSKTFTKIVYVFSATFFNQYLDKDFWINGRNTPKILNFEITR